MARQLRPAHFHRVAGTQLLGLFHELNVGVLAEGLPHQVGPISDHDQQMLDARTAQRVEDIFDHRSAADGTEDFGQVRFHPGPFAGGQNDCQSFAHRVDRQNGRRENQELAILPRTADRYQRGAAGSSPVLAVCALTWWQAGRYNHRFSYIRTRAMGRPLGWEGHFLGRSDCQSRYVNRSPGLDPPVPRQDHGHQARRQRDGGRGCPAPPAARHRLHGNGRHAAGRGARRRGGDQPRHGGGRDPGAVRPGTPLHGRGHAADCRTGAGDRHESAHCPPDRRAGRPGHEPEFSDDQRAVRRTDRLGGRRRTPRSIWATWGR